MTLVIYLFLAIYFNADARFIGICLLPPLSDTKTIDICSDEQ